MEKNLYNLTNPQKSILLTEEFYKGSNINNICGTAIIENELNFDLLKKAINLVARNNDSFNLKLVLDDNEIKQYLASPADIDIEIVNINSKDDISKIENNLMDHVFDIYNGDLFCFKIFKFPNNTGGFMLNIHHLFADSWTLGITTKKIIQTYISLLNGEDVSKNDDFSYVNYIYSEKEYLDSYKFKKDKAYWEGIFDTVPELATIPSSKETLQDDFSPKANRKSFNIDQNIMKKINDFCKSCKVSVFNFFMAVYAIYIGRVSGVDDFVIGTPILNRTNFNEKNITGMFINTAPLRFLIDDNLSFKSFVSGIAKNSLGMLRHQKYYYQNILEDLREKDSSLPNLYNILISYQVTKANTEKGLNYSTRWNFNGTSNDDIDIHLYDLDDTGSINITYDYRVAKYEDSDIEDIHNRILHIIWQILERDDVCLKDIEIVTSKEKYTMLYGFNNTNLDYDENVPFISYFEEQAKLYPNRIAITFHNKNMDYETLNKKANSLAHLLRESGITNNSIVGIMMNRSFEMIISILAVLKSGGGYIPIDPDYPDNRINYMIEDSKMQILLSQNDLDKSVHCKNIINVNLKQDFYNSNIENIESISKPEDLSYLIYTSGSTGNPKGVMLTQKSLVNFYHAMREKISYLTDNEVHRIISITTVSFDIFAFETLISLANGLHLFMTDNFEQKSTEQLEMLISKYNIEIIQSTPSVMRFHLDNLQNKDSFSSLKYVILAGEQLPLDLVQIIKNISPNCTIYNGYGPSETTIFSSVQNVTNLKKINIGKPIANTQFYILDKHKHLLPKNHVGEIYIAGDGVGNGYLFKEDLTNNNFLPNPFSDGSLLYKTGDLGLWLDNGCIECRGRIDHQIKLRGLRIELGEIENKINSFNRDIKSAVVVRKEHNVDFLYAFIESTTSIDISILRTFLKSCLPNYMIPSYFVFLDELPKTPNGKIDRKILTTYNIDNKVISKEKFIPKTALEQNIFDIIADILGNRDFDMNDDFLSIGMDSLTLINFSTRIQNEFNIQISIKQLYDFSSVCDFLTFLETAPKKDTIQISKAPKMDYYPLSSAQKRIYYASKQLGKNSLAYNITGGLLVNKVLNKEKLLTVAKELINRHSIFKMSYTFKNNDIMQCINDNINIDIPVFYDNFNNLDNILNSFQKPFYLEKDLLIRFYIYYLDNNKTLLLIDTHHIAVDGVSLSIFIKELCKLYNGETLEDLRIDYRDFAVWENDFLNSDNIKELENYWVGKFKDSTLPSINLPYDYVKSNSINDNGGRVNYKMDKSLFERYENFAKELNVSNYTLFLSVLLILLYKYTNQEELIVGSATVGRENSDVYNIIGTFVNNIVIDARMKSNQSFGDFVKYMNSQVIDDLAHQSYPYDLLVKKLSNLTGNYRNSLFDVSFTYQNANKESYTIDNTNIQILDIYSNTAKFNLLLEIRPKDFVFSFEYNSNLFKRETIESLLKHYLFVLSQVAKNDSILIDNIDILTNEEYKLLDKFNDTDGIINNDTFVSIFENEVKNNPNNIALICDDKTLTYNELNKKANSLAHYLIKNGIGANDIVCIMTNRSFETIVCMLGILKAGACFFNVDPTYPIERTQYYLSDSKTKYVLTQKALKDKVQSIENCIEIDLDNDAIYNSNFDNPNIKVGMQDLSYIIYTSGSTGTPKGVMLNQVGLANMVKAMAKVLDYLKEGNRHTIASVTSTPFDIFVYEIVVSLAHGMKVVMANNAEHRNPKLLDALIRKYNVDVMTVTPSLMKINYDNREPDSALALVKNMVFGGEPLPEKFVKDLKALADDITIYNIYGPSEITVLSNVQNLDGEKEITVGPPIMNTQIHILDNNMKRVPIGVVGEIYISGIQVGLGYIGKPDMTSEKFIDNPFGEGKIYRSGDIGRWTFDGKVQILGRVDHQIKLRGLRIELGEIENVMLSVEGVSSAVVNKIEIEGKEVLCGYYVANSSVLESTIKDTLRNSLPHYMVPTYIVRLDEMPYTINRKVDRKALPLPNLNKTTSYNKVNINELNSNEEKLLQIWKNILKLDNIDINDNFFDIGGDSISAINMQIEALKYGLNFEYADIFNYPTIAQLSNKLPSPISKFMQDYDYSRVNEVLKRNTIDNLNTIKKVDVNNILLIGSTGYLGAHIIDEFMKSNPNGTIYCLIRQKNNKLPLDRLKEVLNFYFKDTYDNEIGNRIKVICGDITEKDLGLSNSDYELISKQVDVIINSGAIVKHFGLKEEFENINVNGTKNVVDFCMTESKRLLHISTISVSGNGEKEETIEETPENINDKKLFYETDIFINQNIKGIYTTTKYKAELIVLEAIYKGLNAQILRVGNITNRYSDGLFQLNVEDNAFAKRLKSFIDMGAFPKYLLQHAIELTPVDLCANAIVKISQYTSDCNVFHIYNSKLLPIKLLIETFSSLGIELEAVSDKLLQNIIVGILNDDNQKDILSGIIYDLDKYHHLIYTSNVRVKYDFSEKYLNTIGFYWKDIDEKYIIKYMNYFKRIGFINY